MKIEDKSLGAQMTNFHDKLKTKGNFFNKAFPSIITKPHLLKTINSTGK